MTKDRIGVYPGTFDPVTRGHLDIITRATRVVDRLIVAVASNAGKGPLFSAAERVAMVEADVAHLNDPPGRVQVKAFDNLLMEFAAREGAGVTIRGLRAVSDFEYEFQMAAMNARLHPEIETLFLMAAERQQFISSKLVKEIGRLGGDITSFVSPAVAGRLKERFAHEKANGEDRKKRVQMG